MPKIESRLNTRSEDFETNRAALLEKIEEVRGLEAAVRGHGEKRRAKFEGRGQLIPRERVERVLDGGMQGPDAGEPLGEAPLEALESGRERGHRSELVAPPVRLRAPDGIECRVPAGELRGVGTEQQRGRPGLEQRADRRDRSGDILVVGGRARTAHDGVAEGVGVRPEQAKRRAAEAQHEEHGADQCPDGPGAFLGTAVGLAENLQR